MKKLFLIFLTLTSMTAGNIAMSQSVVTFYTTMGTFEAEMYDTLQPITAGNFLSLVDTQFYDGIIFHRVVQGFVIQGGDPLGTGFGGPGYSIPDEFDPNTSNIQKAFGMANSGPNTGGSQFFINLVSNTSLDPNYPVFGIVTTNFSVVQAIGNVPVDGNDKPLTNVVMDSVRTTGPMTSLEYFSGEIPLIEIFPNPVTENSTFRVLAKSVNQGHIAIYDQMGNEVYREAEHWNGEVLVLELADMRNMNMSSGIYYFVVSDGRSVSQRKFVVAE